MASPIIDFAIRQWALRWLVSFIEAQAQRPKTVININVLSLREDAGLVGGELGLEGVDGVEAALVTDLAVEGNFEVEAVDVLVEIEDIGLDGALAAGTDGRTDTNVAHSLELTAKGLGLNGIDTVARQKLQRLVKLDVRCRETDRAAEPVARHNYSKQ